MDECHADPTLSLTAYQRNSQNSESAWQNFGNIGRKKLSRIGVPRREPLPRKRSRLSLGWGRESTSLSTTGTYHDQQISRKRIRIVFRYVFDLYSPMGLGNISCWHRPTQTGPPTHEQSGWNSAALVVFDNVRRKSSFRFKSQIDSSIRTISILAPFHRQQRHSFQFTIHSN